MIRMPATYRLLSLCVIFALLLMGVSPILAQEGGSTTHVVQPGENLYRIALQYGISVDALMAANQLTNASVVRSGQQLVISGVTSPAVVANVSTTSPTGIARGTARTHQVAPGENLLAIARLYSVTLDALMATNNLMNSEIVPVGQVLQIPAVESAALPDFALASPDLGLIGINELAVPPAARDPLKPPDMGIIPPGSAATSSAYAPAENPAPASAPNEEQSLAVLENKLPPASDETPESMEQPASNAPESPIEEDSAASEPVEASEPETISEASEAGEAASESAPGEEAVEETDDVAETDAPGSDLGIIGGAELTEADLGILPAYVPEWLFTTDIISTGGDNVREIYQRGLELGNNPYAFSKIGDCNSEPPFFLEKFDLGLYDLGPFNYLQSAIIHFEGSFARKSATVWTGNHAWAVFDPIWANPAQCLPGETPLACEFRVNKPSVVLIRLGTNEVGSPQLFEANLRQIVDFAIERGTIPILGTKADRLEGSDQMNDMIRALAAEYEIPLWDFGRAADMIAGRGLGPDGFHLSYYPPQYADSSAYQFGHSLQNLTALMALNSVWRNVMY